MRRTGTTRRGALTATGAIAMGAVLAGCGSDSDEGSTGRQGSARAAAGRSSTGRAEASLRAQARSVSSSLFAQYETVVRAHPATAAGLTPLRDAVRAHIAALGPGDALGLVRTRPGTGDARAAVRELAAAERRAAVSHTQALMKAPPELARLLASVAAAASAHAYLLTELAKETKA
ncbi:hypothetical protein [Streptomyces sp. NBC_01013]|uniref:hypothetical protein n=1 Tax=Streptomyces sp. NBC_01013 TaxID=2903718 RepID=UPI00386C260D|nr:hypothetical protein OG538_09150 [Streptomyces sp. NBC_01013]